MTMEAAQPAMRLTNIEDGETIHQVLELLLPHKIIADKRISAVFW